MITELKVNQIIESTHGERWVCVHITEIDLSDLGYSKYEKLYWLVNTDGNITKSILSEVLRSSTVLNTFGADSSYYDYFKKFPEKFI